MIMINKAELGFLKNGGNGGGSRKELLRLIFLEQ